MRTAVLGDILLYTLWHVSKNRVYVLIFNLCIAHICYFYKYSTGYEFWKSSSRFWMWDSKPTNPIIRWVPPLQPSYPRSVWDMRKWTQWHEAHTKSELSWVVRCSPMVGPAPLSDNGGSCNWSPVQERSLNAQGPDGATVPQTVE